MSKRSRISNEDGDVLPVELIHRIQSLLPHKEGGRTCILSKSWLRAWYTIPTLKLMHPEPYKLFSTHKIETKFNKLIHTTLQRYHINNTPIQSFHLLLSICFKKNLGNVGNWIRLVVSKTCLKELSLDIRIRFDDSFTLPNELFSSQGLHTIHVKAAKTTRDVTNLRLRICSTNVINCVSLRVLNLDFVFINQGMFRNLLSTCSLLEKIKLTWCGGFNNVKVKNLLRLTELDIYLIQNDDLWEINNVPSLCSFRYRYLFAHRKPIPFQMYSLAKRSILDSIVHLDDIDVDDLRRRVLFSVENVKLELATGLDKHAWEQSTIKRLILAGKQLEDGRTLAEGVHSPPFPTSLCWPMIMVLEDEGILWKTRVS
ncbi:F-box protein-like protein [Tanacetum coccineum]